MPGCATLAENMRSVNAFLAVPAGLRYEAGETVEVELLGHCRRGVELKAVTRCGELCGRRGCRRPVRSQGLLAGSSGVLGGGVLPAASA